jgi:NADP-dependent 3-hydroxy acid dehydrogenase YdfG
MSVEDHFHGKGCVVIGAASGIGYAGSEALLNVGATVFMADRDTKTLTSFVGQLRAHAGRGHSTTGLGQVCQYCSTGAAAGN